MKINKEDMSRLNDESDDFGQGYMFNKRYRLVEELTPGGQARVFVVEDIDSSNKKYSFKLTNRKMKIIFKTIY